jgi:hypothetical protein
MIKINLLKVNQDKESSKGNDKEVPLKEKIGLLFSNLQNKSENSQSDENSFEELMEVTQKVHLIKFAFKNDNEETIKSVKEVLNNFPSTNRFIVDNNIRMYNSILKDIPGKKYYVQNSNDKLVSFFRKNNKVVFSFHSLNKEFEDFFLNEDIFNDLLYNVEVIIMEPYQLDEMKWAMKNWNGNVILHDDKYPI